MFSLELPHCTHVIYSFHNIKKKQFSLYKKKKIINYPKSAGMRFFSKGLKNKFESAKVNEPSVFKPLKVYCNLFRTYWTTLYEK